MNAYPIYGKAKSRDICNAFLQGAPKDAKGNVFYGVDSTNINDWRGCCARGETWWYVDNSYFDKTRGSYFRITKGALQHSGEGQSNGQRFKSLALEIRPWREYGEHIVICPQSESFMRDIAGWKNDWQAEAIRVMLISTHRGLKIRPWERDKAKAAATLQGDLVNAWALVTYSSAAAVTALLEGVPVACNAGACHSMGVQALDIEDPLYPPDRERFFGVLADNQWTLSEIKDGTAWKWLNERHE